MSDGAPDFADRVERLEASTSALTERLECLELLLKDLLLRFPTADAPPLQATPTAPARTTPTALTAAADERYLVVRIERRRLGVPLTSVREIVRMAALQAIPDSSPALEGMLDLRGQPVDVLDLRLPFGLERLADDLDSRVVICDVAGRACGLKVDEVLTVVPVDPGCVEPPPDLTRSDYLAGVVRIEGELVLLLEPARLLAALGQKEALSPIGEQGEAEVS